MDHRSIGRRLRMSALATSLVLTAACAHGIIYVRVGPPPVRVEVLSPRPGVEFVWITGHWWWDHATYVWIPGRWERPPRPHVIWIEGRWRERGRRGWRWEPGHWK